MHEIILLFFVYQLMLFVKTRNLLLCFVTTAIFMGLFATSILVKTYTMPIIFFLLVIEFAGILYMLIWKK